MDKNALIERVASNNDLSKAATKTIVESVLTSISAGLADSGSVDLHGFGKFEVKSRPERQGRNPATGETITIAASQSVSFKAKKALKDLL